MYRKSGLQTQATEMEIQGARTTIRIASLWLKDPDVTAKEQPFVSSKPRQSECTVRVWESLPQEDFLYHNLLSPLPFRINHPSHFAPFLRSTFHLYS